MSALFNEKAKGWDSTEISRTLSPAVASSILEHIPLLDNMLAMEFGAGTELLCSQIAPHVKKIFAVDTSEAMLDKLASKSELQGKVKVICQDITDKPINKKFDLIISAMSLHHVKDTHNLIQRFAEHLNSGALIALADLDKEDGSFHPEDTKSVFHQGFERNELQSILEEHGFGDIHFYTAYTINREDKEFPVFLATAKKR